MFEALVMGGASLLGGKIAGDAAEDAARAQSESTNAAIAGSRSANELARLDSAPYREAGSAAIGRISELLGLGNPAAVQKDPRFQQIKDRIYNYYNTNHQQQYGIPLDASGDLRNLELVRQKIDSQAQQEFQQQFPDAVTQSAAPDAGALNKRFTVGDFYDDPVTKLGMEFGLNEGTKAINAGAGAAGLRNSGATLKALTKFGTDYAGTKAGESYNRFYADQDRVFNRLSGVAGSGQTSQTNTSNLGVNTAGNVGNMMTAEGNARGAAAISKGNAWSGALNTVGNWWNSNNQLNKILNRPTVGGYGMPTSSFDYTGWSSAGGNQYG